MNTKLKTLSYIIGASLVIGGVVLAGSLTPTVVDTNTTSMVTLQDLWNKTQDFTYSTSSSPRYVSTSSSPLASFRSLQDVWDSLTENPITSNIILTGNTVLGVEGSATAGAPALVWSNIAPTRLCWDASDFSSEANCSIDGWTAEGYGALEYCENLVEGGSSNWRLPSITELLAGLSGQVLEVPATVSGFDEMLTYYWAAAYPYTPIHAYRATSNQTMTQVTADYTTKGVRHAVRCVR
jgi:hypothetical protein